MTAVASGGLLAPGFADPVHDAQRTFRAALTALAQPGRPFRIALPETPPGPLREQPALAAVLLALADRDTPVWWQRPDAALARWLHFHAGAPAAAAPGHASFAVIVDPTDPQVPPLSAFPPGTDEAPHTSATLLVQLASLDGGPLRRWQGPGIDGGRPVALPVPEAWWSMRARAVAGFPCGVDVLFACGDQLLGLPRTTRAGAEPTPEAR